MIERFHWCTAGMYTSKMVKRFVMAGGDYDRVVVGIAWELLRLISEVNTGVQVCHEYKPHHRFQSQVIMGNNDRYWLDENDNLDVFVRYIETLREELQLMKRNLPLVGFFTTVARLRRAINLGAFTLGAITEIHDTDYVVNNDRLAGAMDFKKATDEHKLEELSREAERLVYVQGDVIVLPEAAYWHLVDPALIDAPISIAALNLLELENL